MVERWHAPQVEFDAVLADAPQLTLHGTPMSVLVDHEDVELVARALEGGPPCEVRPSTATPVGRLTVGPLEIPGSSSYIAVTWTSDAPDLWGHQECRRSLTTLDGARGLASRLREHRA